ncbi:hypothetical protein ABZ464_16825 [Streptomyces sp. NPDC005820]|uniref:hypothetical protein n=1 Tax=Streptomyces sp. NPDC005820 TaxID=3157069 RepID=UPI0033F62147
MSPTVSTALGTGSLALAAVASWSSLLLVVRGRVVPGWAVSAALLATALLLRWTLTRAARPTAAPGLRPKRNGWAQLGIGLLIGTAVLGIAAGALDDLISDVRYHVLPPEGPDGCTAVVRETSFLMAGNGEAYAVGRTGLALGTAGSWRVDDGDRPVEAGRYELDWGPDGGVLRVNGTATDPVLGGGAADIDC